MKKSTIKTVVFVVIVVMLIGLRNYYYRNYKVDNAFLDGIAEITISLEIKRLNNEPYSLEEYDDNNFFLNYGEMGSDSYKEIEIKDRVMGMSKMLYEFHEAKILGEEGLADEEMAKYLIYLEELKLLLEPYQNRNDDIEALWEKRIFTD